MTSAQPFGCAAALFNPETRGNLKSLSRVDNAPNYWFAKIDVCDRRRIVDAFTSFADWLYVKDHARALDVIVQRGRMGRSTMSAAETGATNIDVVRRIWVLLDRLRLIGPSVRRVRHLRRGPAEETICDTQSTRPSLSASSDGVRSRLSTAGSRKRFVDISTTNGGGALCASDQAMLVTTSFMEPASASNCGGRPNASAARPSSPIMCPTRNAMALLNSIAPDGQSRSRKSLQSQSRTGR